MWMHLANGNTKTQICRVSNITIMVKPLNSECWKRSFGPLTVCYFNTKHSTETFLPFSYTGLALAKILLKVTQGLYEKGKSSSVSTSSNSVPHFAVRKQRDWQHVWMMQYIAIKFTCVTCCGWEGWHIMHCIYHMNEQTNKKYKVINLQGLLFLTAHSVRY